MAKPSSPKLDPPVVRRTPGDAVDAHIDALFRLVPDPEPLSPRELARVRARLSTKTPRRAARAFRDALGFAAVFVAGAGVAAAGWGVREWVGREPAVSAAAPRAPAPAAKPARSARAIERRDVEPRTVIPPLPSSSAGTTATGAAAPQRAEPHAAASQTDPLRDSGALHTEGALARESALLQRALTALRRDRDPRAALALLDRHAGEFPGGALILEASIARVDALLLLDRRREALGVLDRLRLEQVGRRAELTVLRAELRSEQDCTRALRDFDAALALRPSPPLHERALFGRAGCRLSLDDAVGGRADLERYLATFPEGRFAAAVRARLEAR